MKIRIHKMPRYIIMSFFYNLIGWGYTSGVAIPWKRDILSPTLRWYIALNRYEKLEARAARKIIEKNETILEIGAGVGFISSYLRKRTPAGKIICIEANPQLIPIIAQTHQKNHIENVEVLNLVTLNNPADSEVDFYCREDFWSSSLDATAGSYKKIVKVKTKDFSDICSFYKPDVLIMDIEGGELDLLENSDLTQFKKIILELHCHLYGLQGSQNILLKILKSGFGYDATNSVRNVLVFQKV